MIAKLLAIRVQLRALNPEVSDLRCVMAKIETTKDISNKIPSTIPAIVREDGA